MFNKKSITVQTWVRKINEGAVTFDDVPSLSNLRDVVGGILDNSKEDEENV